MRQNEEDANRKTGYSIDEKNSYLFEDDVAVTTSALPGKVYVNTLAQVEMYYDEKSDFVVDCTVHEMIATIYDYNTHEVLKELNIKEIINSTGDYIYTSGSYENSITEENNEIYLIYLVTEKKKMCIHMKMLK